MVVLTKRNSLVGLGVVEVVMLEASGAHLVRKDAHGRFGKFSCLNHISNILYSFYTFGMIISVLLDPFAGRCKSFFGAAVLLFLFSVLWILTLCFYAFGRAFLAFIRAAESTVLAALAKIIEGLRFLAVATHTLSLGLFEVVLARCLAALLVAVALLGFPAPFGSAVLVGFLAVAVLAQGLYSLLAARVDVELRGGLGPITTGALLGSGSSFGHSDTSYVPIIYNRNADVNWHRFCLARGSAGVV